MTRKRSLGILALLALAFVATAAPPAIPATPAPVKVLLARPFTLASPATHQWQAEKPTYTAGWIVVLDVDPDLVYPRQVEEPVLYAGSHPAERVNVGYTSGRVVAIVPVDKDDPLDPRAFRFDRHLVFFGQPRFPEQVTEAQVKAEVKRAERAGIKPLATTALRKALDAGGEVRALANLAAVYREAGALVLKYAPDEEELARAKMDTPG